MTYVDKLTQDDFRRVKSAYPVMNELIRPTAKITSWKTVIGQISRLELAESQTDPTLSPVRANRRDFSFEIRNFIGRRRFRGDMDEVTAIFDDIR